MAGFGWEGGEELRVSAEILIYFWLQVELTWPGLCREAVSEYEARWGRRPPSEFELEISFFFPGKIARSVADSTFLPLLGVA